jgi:hypothetical protein
LLNSETRSSRDKAVKPTTVARDVSRSVGATKAASDDSSSPADGSLVGP